MSTMSTDPLSAATLADAEKYVYRVSCKECERSLNIDLVALRNQLGADFPIRRLKQRLGCKSCGSRDTTIVFIVLDSSIGREYADKDSDER